MVVPASAALVFVMFFIRNPLILLVLILGTSFDFPGGILPPAHAIVWLVYLWPIVVASIVILLVNLWAMMVMPLSYKVIFLIILFNVALVVMMSAAATCNIGIMMAWLQDWPSIIVAVVIVLSCPRMIVCGTWALRCLCHSCHEGFKALGTELLKFFEFARVLGSLCVCDLPYRPCMLL